MGFFTDAYKHWSSSFDLLTCNSWDSAGFVAVLSELTPFSHLLQDSFGILDDPQNRARERETKQKKKARDMATYRRLPVARLGLSLIANVSSLMEFLEISPWLRPPFSSSFFSASSRLFFFFLVLDLVLFYRSAGRRQQSTLDGRRLIINDRSDEALSYSICASVDLHLSSSTISSTPLWRFSLTERERVAQNIKEFQRISKDIKRYQKISKNIKRYQRISDCSRTCLWVI